MIAKQPKWPSKYEWEIIKEESGDTSSCSTRRMVPRGWLVQTHGWKWL